MSSQDSYNTGDGAYSRRQPPQPHVGGDDMARPLQSRVQTPQPHVSPFIPGEFTAFPLFRNPTQLSEYFSRPPLHITQTLGSTSASADELPPGSLQTAPVSIHRAPLDHDSDSSEENLIDATSNDMQPESSTLAESPTLIDYASWKMDEIRKECTRRKLRLPKNTNKPDRIEALRRYDEAKLVYAKKRCGDNTQGFDQDTTRSKHCMFRLLNILFSNEFAERFCRTGDTVTRAELDYKLVNERSDFWLEVRAAFVEDCPEDDDRNLLAFDDDAYFTGINPALAKKVHSPKKLYSMWKEVNKNNSDAQQRFSRVPEQKRTLHCLQGIAWRLPTLWPFKIANSVLTL